MSVFSDRRCQISALAHLCDRSTPNYAGGSVDVGSQTNDVFHGLHHPGTGSASSGIRLSADRDNDACSGFTARCGPVTCSTPLTLPMTDVMDEIRGSSAFAIRQ